MLAHVDCRQSSGQQRSQRQSSRSTRAETWRTSLRSASRASSSFIICHLIVTLLEAVRLMNPTAQQATRPARTAVWRSACAEHDSRVYLIAHQHRLVDLLFLTGPDIPRNATAAQAVRGMGINGHAESHSGGAVPDANGTSEHYHVAEDDQTLEQVSCGLRDDPVG